MRTRFVTAVAVAAAVSGFLAGSDLAAGLRPGVVAKPSAYGRILFDGRGFVLYGFTRDRRSKSSCTRTCAKAWPPYIVKSRPPAGKGIARARLGTIRRPGGRLQVTYYGHPLYYYVGDRSPGQILCQNVTEYGGIWRVVRPSGRLVRP